MLLARQVAQMLAFALVGTRMACLEVVAAVHNYNMLEEDSISSREMMEYEKHKVSHSSRRDSHAACIRRHMGSSMHEISADSRPTSMRSENSLKGKPSDSPIVSPLDSPLISAAEMSMLPSGVMPHMALDDAIFKHR